MVEILHSAVKGRTRYKVKELYRSEIFRRHIELHLSGKKEISSFTVNTLTGSILIHYNFDNTPQTVASIIETAVTTYNSVSSKEAKKTLKSGSVVIDRSVPSRVTRKETIKRVKLRRLVLSAEDQKHEDWHLHGYEYAIEMLNSDKSSGLSSETAKKNITKYGPNILPEAVPRSGLSIFLSQFKSLPVALLGVAAGVSVMTGGFVDAIVIMGVMMINAVIGYATETQAEKTIHSLKNLVRPSATVLRDRRITEIGAEHIVPGDILILRPGSYIAADARLVEAMHLSVDESALTGESLPVTKSVGMIKDMQTTVPIADRTNMVYMGTLVTGGQGLAIVVATGRFTELGKIQTLVGDAKPPKTPMERQLDKMGTQLVLIGSAVCGVVFIIGIIRGYGFLQMLKSSISLAVAAVPEGLPTIATTTLALGIRNMRKHNVLIRHLDAVETLGSIQTICLDKTGTITMNRMSVVSIVAGMQRIDVSDGIFTLKNKPEYSENRKIRGVRKDDSISLYQYDELLKLINITVLCNESEVEKKGDNFVVNGSSTENALIYLAISSGVDITALRTKFPVIKIQHRSENRNYMATLHEIKIHGSENHRGKLIAVKGSPNEVLAMCFFQLKEGKKIYLTDDDRLAIEIENERMAGDALRVLGVAYAFIDEGYERGNPDFKGDSSTVDDYLDADGKMLLHDLKLVWVGLVGMSDPLRVGVKELMPQFHNAGIDTVIITGDQTPTAFAIGKELNLGNGDQLEILDSTHLADIDPEVMKALCEKVHIFARVSPIHKLQIVQALQSAGKVVAMTGDGINDGPALKAANIGIAMGHTGTDVAREVADVVLEDDNMETMIIAISQGRTIYNNIRKFVHFLLSTNLSEIIVMFTAIAAGIGHPLSAMQLLWINLMSDIAPGLALALEPPEPDVMSQPPRNPDEPIVRQSDFKRITFEASMLAAGSFGAYGYGAMRYGRGPQAGTMAFLSLTMGQLLHAASCRSEKTSIFDKEKLPPNSYMNIALAASFGMQGLAMVIPAMRRFLGIAPIGIVDGLVVGCSAVMPYLINEATKDKR